MTTKSLTDGASSPLSRASRRDATICDTSTSAETVKTGIVVADSTILRAIVACVGVGSRTLTSPLPETGACAVEPRSCPPRPPLVVTSSTVIRPPGPVPVSAVEGDAELDRGPPRDRRRDGTCGAEPSAAGAALGGGVAAGGGARRLGLRRRTAVPRGRRAVAVREGRDRLSDRHGRALGSEDRVERPVPLGLVDDGRLVGLDLDQTLASLEGLARATSASGG